MDYIIFDMEWNQPADDSVMVRSPLYLTGEIIEIGAVKLDADFRLVDELKLYIRPQYYQKLHRKIATLTGIRDQILQEQGLPFPEAFAKFRDFCGEDFAYMTWSTTDLPMLVDNMVLHGMDVSRLPLFCDLQRVFGREIMRQERRHSLEEAMEVLGVTGGAAHDALNDAKNTALVCEKMDLGDYIAEYTGLVFSEAPLTQVFASRQEALAEEGLRRFPCPWCGETVECESWLSLGSRGLAAMGACPEGDEFLAQLAVESAGLSRHRPKRMFYELTDDLYDLYMDRKEQGAAAR